MVSKFRNDKVQSTLNGQSPHHTCQLLSGINICWSSSWWTSTVLTATGPGWHPWGRQSVASSKPWAYKWVWVKLFQWNSIQFSEHCARNWFNLKTITLVPHRFVHHRETPFTLGTTSPKRYLVSRLSTSSIIQAKKTLDKFESVSSLHITAVRQLISMFVAFYAPTLDLFAPPDAQFYTLGGGESIGERCTALM